MIKRKKNITKDEFYAELDYKFDRRQRPEEIRKWLEAIYESSLATGAINAADIAEEMHDEELHIACTSELAAFCRSVSDYESSVRYYKEVMEDVKSVFGEASFEYAVTVNNLAGTYRQMQEMQQAEELFLEAKELFENCHGEMQFLYASVLNNLGLLHMDTQREEEGLALMKRSMDILEKLGGHEEDIATGLLNQAYYYAGENQDQQALPLLLKAIGIFSALPYQNPHAISARTLHGQLLSRSGQDEEAEKYLLLVLEEIEAAFGKNKDYCTVLQSLASHCRKYGRAEEAADYEEKAAQCLRQIFGDGQAKAGSHG